ncbi:hypothetical protein K2Q16_02850 [Patescibacteria group bacterium]|nr:hypothetical protein [Patescibacteria group bacterium]
MPRKVTKTRKTSSLTLLYSGVALATLALAYFAITRIDTLTYKIVVVFLSLIILSNCAAKLYGRHVLNENI